MHSCKSLLFNNISVWIKREGDPDFDVTMGSFDGTETCEPVGVYILNVLGEKYGKERVGLYRNDALAYIENVRRPQAEKIKKDVIKIFKQEFDLNITSETNLRIVNFLDVTFNLSTGKYHPYNKPDNDLLYIHVNSNDPPNITKTLPDSISKRINKLTSEERVFNSAKNLYNNALKNGDYKQISNSSIMKWLKRKKENPTDIHRQFFVLLDKDFPKTHTFYEIFDRNNVKVSYSSMPNISIIIKSHHKQILSNNESISSKSSSNCKEKSFCPLNGSC